MPRVSVIITAYNSGRFMADALDSVLRQSYEDWEIVVADSSTDDTRSVVEDRIRSFGGRLRYLFQPKCGVSAARNAAIQMSRGSIIATQARAGAARAAVTQKIAAGAIA